MAAGYCRVRSCCAHTGLNWGKITSWGLWAKSDGTATSPQTQDSKFEADHLPLIHRGSPQYRIFTSEQGRNVFVSFKSERRTSLRASAWQTIGVATTQGIRPCLGQRALFAFYSVSLYLCCNLSSWASCHIKFLVWISRSLLCSFI